LLAGAQSRRPTFDAASIKPSVSPAANQSIGPAGDRLVASGTSLRILVQYAYRWDGGRPFLNSQIVGVPDWGLNDRFDVQAKAADGRVVTQGELEAMTQAMLEDRFQLKTHREMRVLPVYSLVVAKGGAKLKRSADQTPPSDDERPRVFDPSAAPRGRFRTIARPSPSGGITIALTGTAIAIPRLLNILQQYLDRPLIDASGVDGLHDVALEFGLAQSQPASTDEATGASLFTAIEEQLGLKIEAQKKSIEVLVVDHAEHPTPD
jgi:uncharacterized protein (TIGR03435 family)